MDLWCCEKFINMAEQILGPDVATHPVWNLRVKPPNNRFNPVPWHQGVYTQSKVCLVTFLGCRQWSCLFVHRFRIFQRGLLRSHDTYCLDSISGHWWTQRWNAGRSSLLHSAACVQKWFFLWKRKTCALKCSEWVGIFCANIHFICIFTQVVKRGHRKGQCGEHTCCHADTWYIVLEEDEMEKSLGEAFFANWESTQVLRRFRMSSLIPYVLLNRSVEVIGQKGVVHCAFLFQDANFLMTLWPAGCRLVGFFFSTTWLRTEGEHHEHNAVQSKLWCSSK